MSFSKPGAEVATNTRGESGSGCKFHHQIDNRTTIIVTTSIQVDRPQLWTGSVIDEVRMHRAAGSRNDSVLLPGNTRQPKVALLRSPVLTTVDGSCTICVTGNGKRVWQK